MIVDLHIQELNGWPATTQTFLNSVDGQFSIPGKWQFDEMCRFTETISKF